MQLHAQARNRAYKAADIIQGLFVLGNSKEGHAYWSAVAEKLRALSEGRDLKPKPVRSSPWHA